MKKLKFTNVEPKQFEDDHRWYVVATDSQGRKWTHPLQGLFVEVRELIERITAADMVCVRGYWKLIG